MLEHVASQTGLVLRNLRLVDDLQSSRQRLVTSQDTQRRRLERDLHDGAQQSLVAIALMLRMAANQKDTEALKASVTQAADQLQAAIAELRELARGIHPAILTDRGLGPAVDSLVERCPVPVEVHNAVTRRLPAQVEGTLYFVVAESLTNVAKYAHATRVSVTLQDGADTVSLEVVDDGIGGADSGGGSGLMGLADRVSVVNGTFTLHSPPGEGTRSAASSRSRRLPPTGRRRHAPSPGAGAVSGSAIRTFMIADVRGYTSYTQTYGDQAAGRLAGTFAEISREVVESNDGQLLELRGDEALCVFDSARDALRAATALQERFVTEAVRTRTCRC